MKRRISVWSPFSRKVELVAGDRRFAMRKEDGGWWKSELPEASLGGGYYFYVDGSKPLPDPRSLSQPWGVHGASSAVDHDLFEWHDGGFRQIPLSQAIIYELHIGTFTSEGTFNGCISKLDYLKDLGITHLELMPVAGYSGLRGWGYDGVNLFAPHRAYGTPDSLKHLVDACHRKDMAVILDVVYNHLGPEGNYLGFFAPYFTDMYKTPWGNAVNFDGAYSNEVRRFYIDNALMWLRDYHFDGLRLDAVHSIHDRSALHFLEELSVAVDALETETGRNLALIAESDLNDPRLILSRDAHGYGLDAQWNDDFHHALHAMLTGEKNGYYGDFGSIEHFIRAYCHGYVYTGQYSGFRKRNHGRPVPERAGERFVVFSQNHDQIGNRAKGDRIGHLVDKEKVKIAAALVLTSPFVPLIFQGEEWGASTPFLYFTDHGDEELGKAVVRGRREEFAGFGWRPEDIPDPQKEETFLRSRLRWEEMEREPHGELHDWYESLITLRKKHPGLSCGRFGGGNVTFDPDRMWMVIQRNNFLVFCNISDKTIRIDKGYKGKILLASSGNIGFNEGNIVLPPRSLAIMETDG